MAHILPVVQKIYLITKLGILCHGDVSLKTDELYLIGFKVKVDWRNSGPFSFSKNTYVLNPVQEIIISDTEP